MKEEGYIAPRFRIYYYTRDEIRHVWTEEEYLDEGYNGNHAVCHQKDALVFTQLCCVSRDNEATSRTCFKARICTVDKDGCNNQESLGFYVEVRMPL